MCVCVCDNKYVALLVSEGEVSIDWLIDGFHFFEGHQTNESMLIYFLTLSLENLVEASSISSSDPREIQA